MVNWYNELLEKIEKFGKNELTKDEIKKIIDKLKDKEKNNDIERRIHNLECEVSKLIYVNRDKLISANENECVCNHSKKERIDLIDRRP